MPKKKAHGEFLLPFILSRGGTLQVNPLDGWTYKYTSKRGNNTYGNLQKEIDDILLELPEMFDVHDYLDKYQEAFPQHRHYSHRVVAQDQTDLYHYAGYGLSYLVGMGLLERISDRGQTAVYKKTEVHPAQLIGKARAIKKKDFDDPHKNFMFEMYGAITREIEGSIQNHKERIGFHQRGLKEAEERLKQVKLAQSKLLA